jgi:hypothetical protein
MTHSTAQHLLVRGLVELATGAMSYKLTRPRRARLAGGNR